MSKKISGAEFALYKIFSSDFEYVIPNYQRPYSWTVDQASELFDDLYDFSQKELDDGYFLGSIVLIKDDGAPRAEVIDGQQRLTTLTILLSALASQMADDNRRKQIGNYICEPGNEFEGLDPRPRLMLRERDQQFFGDYIQDMAIDRLAGIDPSNLDNEAQRNIRANALLLQARLASKYADDQVGLMTFGQFLLKNCFLVAVWTPSQESAFRVFSVMNSRGLDLQPTDIIKADIIGQIAADKQAAFSERWEDMEVELGRAGFNDLFTFIRMIYAKDKAKRALLEEFRTHVVPKAKNNIDLVADILEPYAEQLAVVRNAEYTATAHAEEVNGYLRWLLRIDNSDWIPPAIMFLRSHHNSSDYCKWYFGRLERLAAFLHIAAKNVNQRIERYAALIASMESPHSLANPPAALDLSDQEKLEFVQALESDIYTLTPRRRNYLILRLDSFMSDGAATYDPTILTIEHVLPQTVDPGSEWERLWPVPDQRKAWVHRIANLVPLNFRRNASASNYDFDIKKTKYFSGTNRASSFCLTTQVLSASDWTPAHVEARQTALIDAMREHWDLA